MARTEIFTHTAIRGLLLNQPYLKLFQKQDWEEYLELIAVIYDLLEERVNRVEFAQVEAVLENFYHSSSAAYVVQKKASFMSMAITELEVLKDSHDVAGARWIEPTREGKQLLKLAEGWIKQRKQFTGTGADVLMGSLNQMLQDQNSMTLEDAISAHQSMIQRYKKDIDRMKAHGVQASEFLNPMISYEELFSQADEAAAHILAAGEDIKVAIENVRKLLVKKYHEQEFSAGQAIEFVADFYQELRQSPIYQSFARAKDILSYIQGLGGSYAIKDIHQILQRLVEKNRMSQDEIRKSNLPHFSKSFQLIIEAIEQKLQEQLRLLRIQVNYVLAGDSKKSREELKELIGLILKNEKNAVQFSEHLRLSVPDRLPLVSGALELHSFEKPERVESQALELNLLDEDESMALAEALKQAEEATVRKVLDRLHLELSKSGEIRLSNYPIRHGIVEAYVLTEIAAFTDMIESVVVQDSSHFDMTFDWNGSVDTYRICLKNIPERIYRIVC